MNGERRGVCGIWLGDLREGDYLEDPGEDGRVVIEMGLQELGRGHGVN